MPCRPLFVTILAMSGISGAAAQDVVPRADPARMEARIRELAETGTAADGGALRVAYSDADLAGRTLVHRWLDALGIEPRIDAAGNLLARRPGSDPDLPPILFGSHIDSVPGGGHYDGDVGVISALEVLDMLAAAGLETRHSLELVVFSNEEGGLVGSKAFAGPLDPAALDEPSHAGVTIGEGIARIGGDPARIVDTVRRPGDYTAFLELHIEQGGILDREGTDIGVVLGIVGIDWWDVTVTGKANHAGTTPMAGRRDALVAASEVVLAVNRIIGASEGAQVGTVGRIEAFPGAPNVIPGRVEMSLEIRDLSNARILGFFESIKAETQAIAARTGTSIDFRKSPIHETAAETDPRLRDLIETAAARRGYSHRRLPSGAGHDAQAIAHIAPVGMIFVPSIGGISHAPDEFTRPEQMARGAEILFDTLLAIDRGAFDGTN